MSKRKAVVRLLGPSIYTDAAIKSLPYPILVEAELCSILNAYATVTESAVRKLLGFGSWDSGLTWFNPWDLISDEREKSWEEVEFNPFEQWNMLKSSRDVGAMPPVREVIR